jgi:CheY-like chemotaxis protein
MENLPELLKAVATLLWPIIVIILLFAFRDGIRLIMESARSRKFSVKVGEMEVSMEEYNRQQSELIKDLQNQVVALQKAMEQIHQTPRDGAKPAPAVPDYSLQAPTGRRSILWVGDHPLKNAVMIQNLLDAGVKVTTATSSREGLSRLRAQHFDKVVTDLNHPNGVTGAALAGIELVRAVRQMKEDIPVYIFTTPRKAEEMFDAAEDAGANQITGSPTILLALLKA